MAFSAFVGDETGLLKQCEWSDSGSFRGACRLGTQSRAAGIRDLCWLDSDGDTLFASAHNDGVVRTWEHSDDDGTDGEADDGGTGAGVGAGAGAGAGPEPSPRRAHCIGQLSTLAKDEGARPLKLTYLPQSDRMGLVDTSGGVRLFTPPMGDLGGAEGASGVPAAFQTGRPTEAAQFFATGSTGLLALGGREADLQLWDVEQGTVAWKAKNVAHDELELRVPVWITAVDFLAEGGGHEMVTGTGHKHLRFYDARAGRQPVASADFGDYRVNALCAIGTGREVAAADTIGTVKVLDARTLKVRRNLTGPVGSVRCLASHRSEPVVAAVGLDRRLHIFDVRNGDSIAAVYLKQRMNTVLLGGGPLLRAEAGAGSRGAGAGDVSDEGDFDGLGEEEAFSDMEEDAASGEEREAAARGGAVGRSDGGGTAPQAAKRRKLRR